MRTHVATLTFHAPADEHIQLFAVAYESGFMLETAYCQLIHLVFSSVADVKEFVRAAYMPHPWGLRMEVDAQE